MIVGLVILFGAVVGFICFSIKDSGFGMWWDIILGIAGSIISSVLMTASYMLNGFGRADTVGFNWYSLSVGVIGALVMIYGAWVYKRSSSLAGIRFHIVRVK